jgi:subtilisin family serine protease
VSREIPLDSPRPFAPVPLDRQARGTTVAIIDSGIDDSHPWLRAARIRHREVTRRGERFAVEPGESGDLSGHGTACAGIIHRMAPAAEIVSIRALGPEGRCTRDGLIAALRYAVHERFHVVNVSLGIDIPRAAPLRPTDYRSIVDLYEVADDAYTAGVVLIAAGPNIASFRTYPGKFKSLIGVGRGSFADADGLRSEITIDYEILAPGNDVLAPALGGGERRFTGTSFACPHVAAQVARLRAAQPELTIEAIKAALHALAAALPARTPRSSA